MSDNPQIAALYQVSQVLLKAFQQINQITGNILNKQTIQSPKIAPKEVQKPKSNPPNQEKGKNKNEKKVNTSSSEPVQKLPAQEKIHQQGKKNSKKQQLEEKVAGKKSQNEDKKKHAHPDKPKQPITPFFRFNSVMIEKIKLEYPDLNQKDLVRASGQIWQKLSAEQKQPFQQQFQKDKKVYEKDLAKFYEKHPEEKKKN